MTQDELKSLLFYDPDKGTFTWLVAPYKNKSFLIGREAGCIEQKDGYRRIRIGRHGYPAHRLVWLYVYGRWPAHVIDHINGVPDDNRLCNLREATFSQNSYNARRAKDNTSGVIGVAPRKGRWIAYHGRDRTKIHLGSFASIEEAAAARKRAIEYRGEFLPTRLERQP